MAAIFQTFSNAFSWMDMYEFCVTFHWRLFLMFELTISQHCIRLWLGADQATSHYLNHYLNHICWRIYASLGLNELNATRLSSLGYPDLPPAWAFVMLTSFFTLWLMILSYTFLPLLANVIPLSFEHLPSIPFFLSFHLLPSCWVFCWVFSDRIFSVRISLVSLSASMKVSSGISSGPTLCLVSVSLALGPSLFCLFVLCCFRVVCSVCFQLLCFCLLHYGTVFFGLPCRCLCFFFPTTLFGMPSGVHFRCFSSCFLYVIVIFLSSFSQSCVFLHNFLISLSLSPFSPLQLLFCFLCILLWLICWIFPILLYCSTSIFLGILVFIYSKDIMIVLSSISFCPIF